MKFCPKCHSMMTPRKVNGNSVYRCPKCGYEEEVAKPTVITSRVKHTERERTIVLEEEMPKGVQTLKGVVCPSCKNEEVYFWMMQTRAADEPPTRFYRCTKCGKTWREYE